jgi:hypothetical protein
MNKDHNNWMAIVDTITRVVGVLFIPILAVMVGNWLESERERNLEAQQQAEQVQRETERLAKLSTQITSSNKLERLFALRMLKGYQAVDNFPEAFEIPLIDMVYRDELDIAAEAHSLLTSLDVPLDENFSDEKKLLELLKPIMVHFARTKQAFLAWDSCKETEIIREGNKFNRDILERERKRLRAADLEKDADKLIKHYDAWLVKYDQIQKEDGDLCKPIFVGTEGYPFPTESEKSFRHKFRQLHSKLEGN